MPIYNFDFFTDVNPDIFRSHPMQVISAAALAHISQPFKDAPDQPGVTREVIYYDPDEPLFPYPIKMTLKLVQLTAALSDLSGTGALGAAQGAPRGRFLFASSTYGLVSAVDVVLLNGMMLDTYILKLADRNSGVVLADDLGIGDRIWVIVAAEAIEFQVGEGTVTATGDLLVTDVDASHSEGGRVRSASAMGTPNAAEIAENTQRKAVGTAFISGAEGAFIPGRLDVRHY